MLNTLFFVNQGTAIVVSAVSSIEMHPTGHAIVFLNNSKAYELTSSKASELIAMISESSEEDY